MTPTPNTRKSKPLPQVEAAPTVKDTPNKPKEKPVTFTVTYDPAHSSICYITATPEVRHPIPAAVVSCLPKEYRKNVRRYFDAHTHYAITDLIRRFYPNIPLDIWAKSIADAYALTKDAPTTADAAAIAPVKSCYIAVDDVLYRLNPVALVSTNKALATARKLAREKATTEATAILEKARKDRDAMTIQAQSDVAMIYDKANHKMAEAEAKLREVGTVPPRWLVESPYPYFYQGGNWRVVLPCHMVIRQFNYKVELGAGRKKLYHWPAKLAEPFTFFYSAPITPRFDVTTLTVIRHLTFNHPHMTKNMSCMSLGDAPNALKSVADLDHLVKAVQRNLSAVEIHSMLPDGGRPESWTEGMWRFVPDNLAPYLRNPLGWQHGMNLWLTEEHAREATANATAPTNSPTITVNGGTASLTPAAPAVTNEVIRIDQEDREVWHS